VQKYVFGIILEVIIAQTFLNMDARHKIDIPKSCHEDWNEMTRLESGIF
jgi:hypothetical protein